MAKTHPLPAHTDVECQSGRPPIIVLNESREIRSHEVSRRITEGRLNGSNPALQEILERRKRVTGSGCGSECKRSAHGKIIEAVQLILDGLAAHAQAMLAFGH